MKPEVNSRRLFGITRSKGKMYELGLPEEAHLAVPSRVQPEQLLLLAVGELGDVAAATVEAAVGSATADNDKSTTIQFAASFFDAFLSARFATDLGRQTQLLASAAYYLSGRPGSSLVLARQRSYDASADLLDKLLHWALQARWRTPRPTGDHPLFKRELERIGDCVAAHFREGEAVEELWALLSRLRADAYRFASSRDLLYVDLLFATIHMRVAASAWLTLPALSGIPSEKWMSALRRPTFPSELWPSQLLLGRQGMLRGRSGIVQMPTSAGKTRAVEMILRSAFLGDRTRLAVVVAPFRALCHEIGASLSAAFAGDDVRVNELSDVMQLDMFGNWTAMLGVEPLGSQHVLVVTPEKLLYALRQAPELAGHVGLVVFDEGHQFDTGTRGVTYELLLTELKALLPAAAQQILISAVIQNASQIRDWLIGARGEVVDGTTLLPTARSVAFASWLDRLGQLMFYESNSFRDPDYFVPRILEQRQLRRQGRETKARVFPAKDTPSDIALALGLRLVANGAVAIFCGQKATATNTAKRAVEIFERGYPGSTPAAATDPEELDRLRRLIEAHFGATSPYAKAAAIGVFVHHGTTPHGLRIALEYAMQKGLVRFVACTSTLAQGVNLPIRYLIVSGMHQAGERISVRDFQNLIGRAGRSGMHTEGLVIFADPAIHDLKQERNERWRFTAATELLRPSGTEVTSSSLLDVFGAFPNSNGSDALILPAEELVAVLLAEEATWETWARSVVDAYKAHGFKVTDLVTDLRRRRKLITAVEGHLMANRQERSPDAFVLAAAELATRTLAYHIADDETRAALSVLFTAVAEYVNSTESEATLQKQYAKTLFGVRAAQRIRQWTDERRETLLATQGNAAWLEATWDLCAELNEDNGVKAIQPPELGKEIAGLWISGEPYAAICRHVGQRGGTKAWGARRRRRLTEDDIINFCEEVVAFNSSLVLGAVGLTLYGEANDLSQDLREFQKALRYGLPDALAIAIYEAGFADRVVAQHIRDELIGLGFEDRSVQVAMQQYPDAFAAVAAQWPAYFATLIS